MAKIKKFSDHNGVNYVRIESLRPVDGALSIKDKKCVINGIPSIELMEGSYKYGRQVQITVFSEIDKYKVEARTDPTSRWNRIEIFFDKKDFDLMIEKYLGLVNNVDQAEFAYEIELFNDEIRRALSAPLTVNKFHHVVVTDEVIYIDGKEYIDGEPEHDQDE